MLRLNLSRLFATALLISLGVLSLPGSACTQESTIDATLSSEIDTLLDSPDLAAGWTGVEIRYLKDNSLIYSRDAHHVFLPASNNKLLTSAAALQFLGPGFAYHTRIYRTGPISRNGTVNGDIIIRGSGDPLLSPPELREMAEQVRKCGIRSVTGHVRWDDSLFDHIWLGDSWAWDDETYYYSAQVGALNLNENLVYLEFAPGRHVGDAVSIAVTPTTRYAAITCTATTSKKGSKPALVIDRVRGKNEITVSGTLPLGVPRAQNLPTGITIENPGRYTAEVLAEYLRRTGISAAPGVSASPPPPAGSIAVAEHVSPPLSRILQLLNKPSDNLVAECLLKTVGAVKTGQGTAGETGTAVQTARTWLLSIGLKPGELHQSDGSGLSRTNFVSPANMVTLLSYLYHRPDFPVIYDSLPIAGVDGSLRNRMKGTAAAGNCHAKTGYVSHVSSISGFVRDRTGEMIVFSMLFNNYLGPNSKATEVQNKVVERLALCARSAAGESR